LNRREKFINANNTEKGNIAELSDIGEATIKANRPLQFFSAKARNNKNVQYGREYGLGDRVLLETISGIVPVRIDTIKRTKAAGRETINLGLRGDG
jgi:hypothetical protein